MAATYTMKDLGYPRTPTDAKYQVTMDNGEVWQVPVQVIVDSRDAHYADDKEDTIGFIRAEQLDRGNIHDWASNNMDWSDVSGFAVEVPAEREKPDYQDGWCNGHKEIIGAL